MNPTSEVLKLKAIDLDDLAILSYLLNQSLVEWGHMIHTKDCFIIQGSRLISHSPSFVYKPFTLQFNQVASVQFLHESNERPSQYTLIGFINLPKASAPLTVYALLEPKLKIELVLTGISVFCES